MVSKVYCDVDKNILVKEKPTSFLSEVEHLAKISEIILEELRLKVHENKQHGYQFDFWDYVCPDTLQGVHIPTIESILNKYLIQSNSERIGLDSNSLEDNTSAFRFKTNNWRRGVYTHQKRIIDTFIDGLEDKIVMFALEQSSKALGDINNLFKFGGFDEVNVSPLLLDGNLSNAVRSLKKELYLASEMKYAENPELLYQICFKEFIKTNGWNELDDKEILKVLEKEQIPKELFEQITGRKIEVSEESITISTGTQQPQPTLTPTPNLTILVNGNYHIIEKPTYAKTIHTLQKECKEDSNTLQPSFIKDDGSEIYRALSFKENFEARVNKYESTTDREEKVKLLKTFLDSCTGIGYLANSTKFKINLICPELIQIPEDFSDSFLSIDYNTFSGTELDRKDDIYNCALTKAEIENHQAWRIVLEDDLPLLRTGRDIVFAELGNPEKAMGFYLLSNPNQNQLRELFVDNLDCDSDAYGNINLSCHARVARVAQ